MPSISFVIPVYNEQETVRELHARLTRMLAEHFQNWAYRIVFVDDGSADGSAAAVEAVHAKDPNVSLISFSRNFGHHIALSAGLDHADGDYVVMMDGDLQDRPEEVPALYKKLQEGYDVAYAERTEKKFGPLKRMTSGLFNACMRRLIHEPIVLNSTIFRMMTKQVVDSIRELRESNRYIVGLIGWVGFRHAPVPVVHGARHAGISKYTTRRRIALALDAIVSFSNYPLRVITKIGLAATAAAFGYGVWIAVKKSVYGTPILGWSSLIVAVVIMGGLQMLMIGVIGEYIGRAYMQDKRRPLYIVKKRIP